ncbi:unnamed protein product [Ectocarpus sp. 4 AP-2014]
MRCSQFCKASAIITVASLLAPQTGAQPASGNEYTYVGCFKDTKEDRILGDQLTSSQEMTTEFCYNYCVGLGALWMATQYAIECWCTNEVDLDYARHGAGAQCNYDCTGDESESCGGFDAFDLYHIDLDSITSDGDAAPTPVDGDTNSDQDNGTEGDGGAALTPVEGDTNNDQDDGTEGGNEYTYVGCFKDSQQDRILGDQLTNYQEMTTEFCYDYCVTKDPTLMATQYGIECWCTSEPEDQVDYARHGEGALCNYDCPGDEDESCGGFNAFELYRIGAAYTTSDGDAAPTPVDGDTNNDQDDGTQGDGDAAPTPVDGDTNNDQDDGTEGDGDAAPTPVDGDAASTPVDGDTNNDQDDGTEGDGDAAPTPVDGDTNNDQDDGTQGDGDAAPTPVDGDAASTPVDGDTNNDQDDGTEGDGDAAPTPVDGDTNNDQDDGTEGDGDAAPTPVDGDAAPTPVDGDTNNDQDDGTEGDGDAAPTPVDGDTNNDQDDGTEGDGDAAPTPVDGDTNNDQDDGTEGDGDAAPTPVDGDTNNDQDDGTEGDGDAAPTPVDGDTNNDQDDGTEGDGSAAPTPVDGETNDDQGNGTEGGNDYTYVGCFMDSQQDRILGDQLTNCQEMTTEFCYDYCVTKDATLMATQYGIECWCTSEPEDQVDYARHGEGALCNYDCAGDEDESCGGFNAFELYRIGAAYTTSDGDTAPTPVDGETNNDQDDGTEGDGDTAPTPVDGGTDNDQGNDTEGKGHVSVVLLPRRSRSCHPMRSKSRKVRNSMHKSARFLTSRELETTSSDATIEGAFSEDIVRIIDVEGIVPGGASWSDSYSVGSKCFMQTTLDHDIGEVVVDTPQGPMKIGELFDLLEPGPGSQDRPLYNDIQCGNGPTNFHNILDEILCPGLVEYGIEGCGQIGPLWDLSELE